MMKVPGLSGKKWIMARQLPFDVHVLRKVRKWQQRANELALDFVDAIGVSPAEEMIYLWSKASLVFVACHRVYFGGP